MRNVRIYVETALAGRADLALPAPQAAHVARVLRMPAGAYLTLFNGDGREYIACIQSAQPREVCVSIESSRAPTRESPLQITLAQALARGEKMDWIIQKATELGVARISPLVTERSEVRLDAARADKRGTHWHAVAIAAAEQCGRNRLPAIDPPRTLEAWLHQDAAITNGARRLALHPEGATALRALGALPSGIVLAIGPEGGFGASDLAALQDAGFRALALGPRVLRTETAGIATLAALQALYGDLG